MLWYSSTRPRIVAAPSALHSEEASLDRLAPSAHPRIRWGAPVFGLLLSLGVRPFVSTPVGDDAAAPASPSSIVALTPLGATTTAQAPPGFRALTPGQTAYTRRGGSYVRAAPSPEAELLSQLFYD